MIPTGRTGLGRFTVARKRIPEREFGITGDVEPRDYDEMLRYCRDHGWIPIDRIVKAIPRGHALECGPGPGYIGLEWLKRTASTQLVGYDISPDMLAIARENARKYGFDGRVQYVEGDVRRLPFADESFDAVFSNDSFHEWSHPVEAFNEIYRVLKPGGIYHVSDLRRDMSVLLKVLIWVICHPKSTRPTWLTSIDASYTCADINTMLARSVLEHWSVNTNAMRFFIVGHKPARGTD